MTAGQAESQCNRDLQLDPDIATTSGRGSGTAAFNLKFDSESVRRGVAGGRRGD